MALICAQGFETIAPNIQAGTNQNSGATDGYALTMLASQGWMVPRSATGNSSVLVYNDTARYAGGQYLNPSVLTSTVQVSTEANRYMDYWYNTPYTWEQVCASGLTVGMAGRVSTSGSYGNSCYFGMGLYGLNTQVNQGIFIYRISANQIRLYIGSYITGALATYDITLIEDYIWHYYELVLKSLSTTTFEVTVVVDGQPLFTTPVLTKSATYQTSKFGAGFNYISITNTTTKNWDGVDDFYISDRTGSTNNEELLGEIQIIRRNPSIDVQAQWTKNGTAPTNAASVANLDYVRATNYVSTTTLGSTDIYGSNDQLPTNAIAVRAVNVETYTNRSTIAQLTTKAVINNGTSTVEGPGWIPNLLSNGYTKTTWDVNPFTNQPFTKDEVNSLNFGITKSA